MAKYSVKAKSPIGVFTSLVTSVVSTFLPTKEWVHLTLFGIGVGAVAGFLLRSSVQRIFEPDDLSARKKRNLVAGFSLAKLAFGFVIILIGIFLVADWLMPALGAIGGYIAGSTVATPLREEDYA